MSDDRSKEQSITLKQHQRILYEIRCKVAVASMNIGNYQNPDAAGDELDSIVEWLDKMGAMS